jgi:hypothetical protein
MAGLKRRLLVFVLGLASWLQAQTTGRMIGTVTDQTGAAIAGAEVVVHSNATGESRTLRSDSAGNFTFPLLQPDLYELTVSAPGFQQKTVENVTVHITETAIINVSLQVGSVQDSIAVAGNRALLQTDGPQLGRVVDARGVSELPLATRNFTQILSLSPGTATYLPDATGVGRNTQAISVNGARVTQNNYQINGTDVNTLGTNGPILVPVPAPETIQEFKVQTSLYDATYGRAGGANVQVLTRSGSNDLHGTAYEYLRNEALNGNDSFLNAAGVKRPVLRRNVFGATLGGPIRRNRTFVFISYQGARETNGASLINSISSNVLVAPGLTDDRSQAALLGTFHPALSGGQAATVIDPAALALLNAKLPDGAYLIPTPGSNGRFTTSSLSFFQEDQFNANFDYVPGPRDSFSAKLFFANTAQQLALPSFRGTGPNVPGFGSDGVFNNRVIALQHVHTLSSSLINEARLGYSSNRANTFPREPIADAQVGIARANAAQYPGLPLIRIAPAAGGVIVGTGTQVDTLAAPSTTTLNDTVSIVHGAHSLRTGGEVRYNLIDFSNRPFIRGQIDFQDFNSFLVGNARTTTIGSGIEGRSWRAFDYNLFAQDDWKISSRVTLSLGLRYELDLPTYDTRGRLATFDPSLYKPRMQVNASGPVGPPVDGIIQAGNVIPQFNLPNLPKGEDSLLRSIDPHNVAPRLGFAASLVKRLVIRGGYGFFYSRPTFQYASLAATLPPYYVLGIQSNVPLTNPFLALPPAQQFPTSIPGVALAGTAFDRNQLVPYFHQFNLTTQYQLSQNWLLETGYVGSRGRRLFRQVAINQAALASATAPITNTVTGAVITTNTADNAQLRAPFQGVSINGFFLNKSDADSSYDSLQVSVVRRFARQLQMLASYTFAKSLDDASGTGGGAGISGVVNSGAVGDSSSVLGNQLARHANRGPSDFSRIHRLVVSYVWDLPAPSLARQSSATRYLFSNWSVSGILTAMSGLPVDIVDTGAGSFYGLANGSNPLARPNFAPGASCETAKQNVPSGYFFNPSAFSSPLVLAGLQIPSSAGANTAGARGTDIGNVSRNCLTGPGQVNLDFAATKSLRFRESRVLEFRTEFFNLLNHANLANPISNLNAVGSSGGSIDANTGLIVLPGNFGRIISTSANPRLIQIAVRVSF